MAIFFVSLWNRHGVADQVLMGLGAFGTFAFCEVLYLLLLRNKLTDMFNTIKWKVLAVEYIMMLILLSAAVSIAFGFDATTNQLLGDAFVWGSFIGLVVYGVKNLQMFALVPEWNIHYLFLDTLKGILVTAASAVVAISVFIQMKFHF